MKTNTSHPLREFAGLLRRLVREAPRQVCQYSPDAVELPPKLAEDWRCVVREADRQKDERYQMIPDALYSLYADALGAANELIKVLQCKHVISAAALTRKIFEDLVGMCYVLADQANILQHALEIYRLPYEERAWYLKQALKHRGSPWAEMTVRNCYERAQRDDDGFCRLHWNMRYDECNASFLQSLGLGKLTDGLSSELLSAGEEPGSTEPWTRATRLKNACEKIDRAVRRGKRNELAFADGSYCHEYDLIYSGFSQLVHGQPAGGDAFGPHDRIDTPPPGPESLTPVAWKAAAYFGHMIRVLCWFTRTKPGDRLQGALDAVDRLRKELPVLLGWTGYDK